MSAEQLKDMWRIARGRYCDGTYIQTGRTTDGDEFDDWLDAMRAPAGKEGIKAGAKVAYDMTPMADSYEDDEQIRRDIDAAINMLDNPYEGREAGNE